MRERGDEPRVRWDQRVTMRDGVELSADVYLPPEGDGPWPVILERTPYDNASGYHLEDALYFSRHDYAVVMQDVRGRGDSDGEWVPDVNEGADGHDTIVWASRQPWSTGVVGMLGGSYGASVQWLAAKEHPPGLAALVSLVCPIRWLEELPWQFGTFMPYWMWYLHLVGGRTMQQPLGTVPPVPNWERVYHHRPLRDLDLALGRTNTVWRRWLAMDSLDDWAALRMDDAFATLDLPVLHMTGWFDDARMGSLFLWEGMTRDSPARDRQRLIVGPWTHGGIWAPSRTLNDRDFGPHSTIETLAVARRFFDYWLKGIDTGLDTDARVRLFLTGDNRWIEGDRWPATETHRRYLRSGGRANTLGGDGRLTPGAPEADEPADQYVYDPDDATPSVQAIEPVPWVAGSYDNRWRLRRDDVLVYTTPPLEADLPVLGVPFVTLYAETDRIDTDWHVTLSDVWPNGYSEELTAGRLRAAWRRGVRVPPSPVEPGAIEEYRIELWPVGHVWKRGHRLRVTVASANFPASSRNPNTNAPIGHDDVWLIATNRVHHTPAHPSHVELPVLRE